MSSIFLVPLPVFHCVWRCITKIQIVFHNGPPEGFFLNDFFKGKRWFDVICSVTLTKCVNKGCETWKFDELSGSSIGQKPSIERGERYLLQLTSDFFQITCSSFCNLKRAWFKVLTLMEDKMEAIYLQRQKVIRNISITAKVSPVLNLHHRPVL